MYAPSDQTSYPQELNSYYHQLRSEARDHAKRGYRKLQDSHISLISEGTYPGHTHTTRQKRD